MKNGKNNKIMNKEFVPLEIARELKEIGFDEECFAGFQLDHKNQMKLFFKPSQSKSLTKIATNVYGRYCHQNNHVIKAPLYQQVFRWFMERYNLVASISTWDDGTFHYSIKNLTGLIYDINCNHIGYFDSLEKVQDECIENLISLLKKDLEENAVTRN